MEILDIDISPLEDAWDAGTRRFHQSVFESVSSACAEGAAEALQQHIYQNRTGDLSDSIGVGDTFRLTSTLIEGEIVAGMRYASHVNEWEEGQAGVGYMDLAAEKAERVLDAGIEVASSVLENAVNSKP